MASSADLMQLSQMMEQKVQELRNVVVSTDQHLQEKMGIAEKNYKDMLDKIDTCLKGMIAENTSRLIALEAQTKQDCSAMKSEISQMIEHKLGNEGTNISAIDLKHGTDAEELR